MRKRVYISGPISKGSIRDNVQQADDAMLALMKAGHAPMNPMLSCYCGGQEGEVFGWRLVPPDPKAHGSFRDIPHAAWIAMDLAWVSVADAVIRLPGESSGADQECSYATVLGVPVFNSVAEFLAWAESSVKVGAA